MKTYNLKSNEIELCGIRYNEEGILSRLPLSVTKGLSEGIVNRNFNAVGARIRFCTNAPRVYIKVTLKEQVPDWAMPLSGAVGADMFVGRGENAKWCGIASPKDYTSLIGEGWATKSSEFEDVVINLPRNHPVTDVEISIADEYTLKRSTPYSVTDPIVFYGSSITEGGCASSAGNAYTSLVSRWLDADYLNLGFSNAARGEQPVADYIASLKMSAFVMDYDHNAYDFELLKATHERFFKTVRNANPDLPIIIITRPDYTPQAKENDRRIEVIRKTYENAINSGDKNVYFISGKTFFEGYDNGLCTVEGCHPNDLGFMLMAKKIYPTLKTALKAE